ncbi:hypothetical protein V1478_010748 [Vespula squamosa]|uniref:Uncharacterized protein n=1 Tax=Vespula squamosa TaxID=30214 RepID=A0ABD2AFW3_VESSQ
MNKRGIVYSDNIRKNLVSRSVWDVTLYTREQKSLFLVLLFCDCPRLARNVTTVKGDRIVKIFSKDSVRKLLQERLLQGFSPDPEYRSGIGC